MTKAEAITILEVSKHMATSGRMYNQAIDMAIEALSERTGEWLEVEVLPEVYDIEGVKTWGSEMQCDQCGFRYTAIEGHMAQYNYCPNCGANMEIKIRMLEGNNETS